MIPGFKDYFISKHSVGITHRHLLSFNIISNHYNKTYVYMETFFIFCYTIQTLPANVLNKGGFFYGIQNIWRLFKRHLF